MLSVLRPNFAPYRILTLSPKLFKLVKQRLNSLQMAVIFANNQKSAKFSSAKNLKSSTLQYMETERFFRTSCMDMK